MASVPSWKARRRTALYDNTEVDPATGRPIIRRIPWDLVEYDGFPPALEPTDTVCNDPLAVRNKRDKPVTDVAYVEESNLFNGATNAGGQINFAL